MCPARRWGVYRQQMVKGKDKVLVALSGGVDSSVAAFLLKERGYGVATATFWLWDYPNSPEYEDGDNSCCSLDTARAVADQLDLPHYEFDFSKEFEEKIVRPTIKSYAKGITPNPCARCNRLVRFDLLLDRADEMGFDYIATGHHVRSSRCDDGWCLLKGVDRNKDQSYFLYGLDQNEIKRAKFPIGNYRKEQIYQIAEGHDLITADVEESQDLCFIPGDDYREFLKTVAPQTLKLGDIVDQNGNLIGRHDGLPRYTIGQRRGLGLENNQALYVTKLDYERNLLVVGPEESLYSSGLIARNCSWILDKPRKTQLEVKIRYRASPVPSEVEVDGNCFKLTFDKPQKSVTPGQIAVLYDDQRLIGGGIIDRILD